MCSFALYWLKLEIYDYKITVEVLRYLRFNFISVYVVYFFIFPIIRQQLFSFILV